MNGVIYFIGIVSTIFLIIFGFSFVSAIGYDVYKYFKWVRKYKGRFDVPPLASCYCIDCTYYSPSHCKCLNYDMHVGKNFFCRDAEPKDHNAFTKREDE